MSRLEAIRRDLVKGDLVLNGFNRWCLRPASRAAMGWTFVESGKTADTVADEIRIARRESGNITAISADETTAQEAIGRIENDLHRPQLLVAARDWGLHPSCDQTFEIMLRMAREHGMVVHVIAALGNSVFADDALFVEAERRRHINCSTLLRPLPRRSKVEIRFGEALAATGLNPIPQLGVANYFLDFAVIGMSAGTPIRLDIEIDGRHWHEELPGRRRIEDERRDQVLRCLGWRPLRFWADDVERNEPQCVEKVCREVASVMPTATAHVMMERK